MAISTSALYPVFFKPEAKLVHTLRSSLQRIFLYHCRKTIVHLLVGKRPADEASARIRSTKQIYIAGERKAGGFTRL